MSGAPRASDRTPSRRAAEANGRRSEFWAALWLTFKFYRVLGRRVKTPLGELDLIALGPDGTLCFIEVKARAKEGAAAEAIGGRQRARIARGGALLGCTSRVTPQSCPIRCDTGDAAPLAASPEGRMAARFMIAGAAIRWGHNAVL